MSNDNNNTFQENLKARSEEAKTVRKIVTIIISSFMLILIVGTIFGYMYIKSAMKPVDPASTEQIEVEIPMGSSSSNIATILESNGIIKDSRIFRFYTKFKNESDFQAGVYTLSPSLTFDDIIEQIKSGIVTEEPTYTVTIPEGKTVEEIADIYANTIPIDRKDFIEIVNNKDYVEQLISTYPELLSESILDPEIVTPLEGYLFAATYDFYEEEPTVELIVKQMIDKTAQVVKPYMEQMKEKGFTVHEALTFASLVEKEAKTKEQRSMIAGVFYNRLEQEMPLQTDPTVLYALGEHKDKVLLKDLETDSPYNTYQIPDLPIGPISNFGENSLEATLNPEETDYLYFLHDQDGNIYYAETHDEHVQLKSQYID